jgi:hypothetical protein
MGFLLGDAGVRGDLVGKAGSGGMSLGIGYCSLKFAAADGGPSEDDHDVLGHTWTI